MDHGLSFLWTLLSSSACIQFHVFELTPLLPIADPCLHVPLLIVVAIFVWLCCQVIRELREEVEKLRLMLKEQGGGVAGGGGGAGGPSGTSANPMDSQDVVMLREKLSISENLMQEMSKTWEQKLVESEKLHQVSDNKLDAIHVIWWHMLQERQKVLEDMGISVKSAGIGVQKDKFYLVNLNADPIMSELLVCYLKVCPLSLP